MYNGHMVMARYYGHWREKVMKEFGAKKVIGCQFIEVPKHQDGKGHKGFQIGVLWTEAKEIAKIAMEAKK